MKNIIVGTAGHIDHGKTTLVKALTGIDADRLPEEKRRGITIDLGFAHVQLTPEIRLGFVDVPGHERFVKNMLAGIGGIELVLFVVAADESIKPQTREHFDICRLLGARHGVIAITKIDSASPDLVDLVQLEMEEMVAGSFLESAPIIPVSAATGAGLHELRDALKDLAGRISERDASGPARLPIDRAFTMRGFGTVVTGTLISGVVSREQEIELLPGNRSVRVRGIQVYGNAADRVVAGTRAALNLAGIEPREIERGMVLAESGKFATTNLVDCRIDLLDSAKPLKHRAPVHFHSGTAEIEAEIRLFGKAAIPAGEASFARLRLRSPAILVPGDRFILRQFSPVVTIGGGSVIDAAPGRERRAARIQERLSVLSGNDAKAKIELLLRESPNGVSVRDLATRLGLTPAQVLAPARQTDAMVMDPPGWILSRNWLQQHRSAVVKAVQERHAASPLSPGAFLHDLRAALFPQAPPCIFEAVLADVPELIVQGDHARHRTHRVALTEDETRARQKIARIFEQAGLTAPSVKEVLASADLDAGRSETILRMLLKQRLLIRVSDDLIIHESAVTQLKSLLAARGNEPFTVATFKQWTGISRKYAVPLLEFLDRERITVRTGDSRTVVRAESGSAKGIRTPI